MNDLSEYLWSVVRSGNLADLPDDQLLKCFLCTKEEAALETIVRRHGPMVWNVCRRTLSHYHDAEDAFQATFLILARKAESIAAPRLLANWLYGVAFQTARRLKVAEAKRHARQAAMDPVPEPNPEQQREEDERCSLLHEELHRLPEKYRAPIVLCELEGKSHQEAADHLGCPIGTLSSRLSRARKRLADRLKRRGVTVPAGALAALLSQQTSGAVPRPLMASAIQAAAAFATRKAGADLIAPRVAHLTEGALEAMAAHRLQKWAALLLLVAALGLGAVGLAALHKEPDPPSEAMASGGEPAEKPGVGPGLDRHGDPLPKGAMARLGTLRWRHFGNVTSVKLLGDGKRLLSQGYLEPFLRIWEVPTGRELHRLDYSGAFIDTAVSNDGRTLVTLALRPGFVVTQLQGDVRVWNVETMTERWQIPGEQKGVCLIALSPDAQRLVVRRRNKLEFWDLNRKQKIRTIAAAGNELGGLFRNPEQIGRLIVSPKGKVLAEWSPLGPGSVLHLLDVRTGRTLHTLEDAQRLPRSSKGLLVGFSSDGKWVARGTPNGILQIIDVQSGKVVHHFKADPDYVFPPVFASDSKQVMARALDGVRVRFWDVKTGKVVRTVGPKRGPGDMIRGAAAGAPSISPNGRFLAITYDRHRARLLDLANGKELQSRDGHRAPIDDFLFSKDGKSVVTTSNDCAAYEWETSTGKLKRRLPLPPNPDYRPSDWSPDGSTYAISEYLDTRRDRVAISEIVLWNALTGKVRKRIDLKPAGVVPECCFSPDGNTLAVEVTLPLPPGASGVRGTELRLYDLQTGKHRVTLPISKSVKGWPRHQPNQPGPCLTFPRVLFSPDSRRIVTGIRQLVVWDAQTGRKLQILRTPEKDRYGLLKGAAGQNFAMAISPDGRSLALGALHDGVVMLEIATGKVQQRFGAFRSEGPPDPRIAKPASQLQPQMPQPGYLVRFSPDGRFLAWCGQQKGEPILWHVATGKELPWPGERPTMVSGLAFSPEGRALFTGHRNGTALVWDLGPVRMALQQPK